ncbi:asparaginyl-tRNA synthetase, partial [mine drainage metagenome]
MSDPPAEPIARIFGPEAVGRRIRIHGWLVRSRSSGGLLFLVVRDRTGQVQVTARRDVLGEADFDRAEHVQIEGSVDIEGTVAEDRRSPGGRELKAARIRVVQSGDPFPVMADQTEEFRLDQRHLVVRSPEMVATFRVKAEILRALREFLSS